MKGGHEKTKHFVPLSLIFFYIGDVKHNFIDFIDEIFVHRFERRFYSGKG